MNGLNKTIIGALAILAVCAANAKTFGIEKVSLRQSANRAVRDVASENPIRQDAKRPYPEIVAEVNGEKITLAQLQEESLKQHGEDVLSRILNRALVLAECKRKGVAITRSDVDAEIERLAKSFRLTKTQYLEVVQKDSSMSYQEYAEEVVWPRLALEALVADQIKPTEEELEAAYLKSYGPSVALQMIVCETKEKADALRSRIVDGGEDFGTVAKDESLDVATASNKGRMQPIFHGTLADKNMEDVLFALDVDQVSPVIGPYGPQNQFVLFRCENKYDPVVPQEQIDAVKDRIRVQASAAKLKAAANDLFAKLGKEAKVQNIIADPNLRAQYPDVAALIDGQPIYLEAVVDMCLKLYAEKDLNSMISLALIRQECKKVGINVTDQDVATDVWIRAAETTFPLQDGSPNIKEYLRGELERYHTTEENYKRTIVWPSVALRKLSEGMVKVTDEDVQKSFEANYGESVQCLGIVLGDERRARDVWQKARTMPAKENRTLEDVFGELASSYSIEPDGKQMRGRIPPIVHNGGYPELEEEAFSLKPGEMSQVIQVDASTYVILYCQERIPAREVTLDDVREQIVSQIRKMREVTAAGEFYAAAVKRSTIVDNLTRQSLVPSSTAEARKSRDARVASPQSDSVRR